MSKKTKKSIKNFEKTVSKTFKKLGLKESNYPTYTGVSDFANSFKQVTMYNAPGVITTASSIN